MDLRKEKVVVETDRYRVTGSMTLPAEGFRSRLSDHVNRDDLMLARAHARLVIPG